MLITPQIKDLVLMYFVEKYEVGAIVDVKRDEEIHGFSDDSLDSFLRHFEKLGLFRFPKQGHATNSSFIFYINLEAHDLILEGGFYGKYQLFQANVEKIFTELDKIDDTVVKEGFDIKKIRMNLKEYLDIIAKSSTLYATFGDSV